MLFADDNAVNRIFGQSLLERQGHEVVVAAGGREALEALSIRPFDLVLLDVQMPEVDGLEVARRVRSGRIPGVPRDLPLVALTAHALQGDRERFLDSGMDDYLSKPIDLKELDRVLGRWARPTSALPSKSEPAGSVHVEDLDRVSERLKDLLGRLPTASVRRLINLSLEELSPGLWRLQTAAEREDFETLAREAHGLRGAWTVLIGTDRMIELTQLLEQCAKDAAGGRACALLEELGIEVTRLREFVEFERERLGV